MIFLWVIVLRNTAVAHAIPPLFDTEILPHSNLALHFSSQFNQGQLST